MAGAQLIRLPRRMQWIGEKQQAVYQLRILRNKDGRLPSSVGMAAQKYRAACSLFHERNRSPQTVAVPGGAARRRRPVRALGAKWQVETQHGEAGCGKGIGHLDEQNRLAVCAGAVRK